MMTEETTQDERTLDALIDAMAITETNGYKVEDDDDDDDDD